MYEVDSDERGLLRVGCMPWLDGLRGQGMTFVSVTNADPASIERYGST